MAQGKSGRTDDHDLHAASHLSPGGKGAEFHEFEFALHHIAEAFSRWSSAVHEYVSGEALPQADVSVLQLIRMNEEPKSAADIGRYLNRDDSSNILYALRKLEKAGFIEKGDSPLRQTTYQVTDRGREVTDRYAAVRQEYLLAEVEAMSGDGDELAAAIRTMWRISGLYEQGARSISVMRVLQGDRSQEPDAPRKQRAPSAESGKLKRAAPSSG